jgi:hypothetical protein
MKKLKYITKGTVVNPTPLHYFVRGQASNGRVHLKCYTVDHKRNRQRDFHPTNTTEVTVGTYDEVRALSSVVSN